MRRGPVHRNASRRAFDTDRAALGVGGLLRVVLPIVLVVASTGCGAAQQRAGADATDAETDAPGTWLSAADLASETAAQAALTRLRAAQSTSNAARARFADAIVTVYAAGRRLSASNPDLGAALQRAATDSAAIEPPAPERVAAWACDRWRRAGRPAPSCEPWESLLAGDALDARGELGPLPGRLVPLVAAEIVVALGEELPTALHRGGPFSEAQLPPQSFTSPATFGGPSCEPLPRASTGKSEADGVAAIAVAARWLRLVEEQTEREAPYPLATATPINQARARLLSLRVPPPDAASVILEATEQRSLNPPRIPWRSLDAGVGPGLELDAVVGRRPLVFVASDGVRVLAGVSAHIARDPGCGGYRVTARSLDPPFSTPPLIALDAGSRGEPASGSGSLASALSSRHDDLRGAHGEPVVLVADANVDAHLVLSIAAAAQEVAGDPVRLASLAPSHDALALLPVAIGPTETRDRPQVSVTVGSQDIAISGEEGVELSRVSWRQPGVLVALHGAIESAIALHDSPTVVFRVYPHGTDAGTLVSMLSLALWQRSTPIETRRTAELFYDAATPRAVEVTAVAEEPAVGEEAPE